MKFDIEKLGHLEQSDPAYRFVYHSWTRAGYMDFAHALRVPALGQKSTGLSRTKVESLVESARTLQSNLVKRLIDESIITMATTTVDGEKAFLGWSCHSLYRPGLLHYCYVKSGCRGFGIARALVGEVEVFSHRSRRFEGFVKWLEGGGAAHEPIL